MTKNIGIIGGMSPESTALYYQTITRKYLELFNNFNFPEIFIYSVKHKKYLDWRIDGRFDLIIQGLSEACSKLKSIGADFVIIATNTMHYFLPEIRKNTSIHIISIIDAVRDKIIEEKINKVGLLGTKFTMSGSFYIDELNKKGIEVLVPNEIDQAYINDKIFSEIAKDVILEETKNEFIRIINDLKTKGAEGIILGCTEIPILINQKDVDIKVFDTLIIHAESALNFALNVNQ